MLDLKGFQRGGNRFVLTFPPRRASDHSDGRRPEWTASASRGSQRGAPAEYRAQPARNAPISRAIGIHRDPASRQTFRLHRAWRSSLSWSAAFQRRATQKHRFEISITSPRLPPHGSAPLLAGEKRHPPAITDHKRPDPDHAPILRTEHLRRRGGGRASSRPASCSMIFPR